MVNLKMITNFFVKVIAKIYFLKTRIMTARYSNKNQNGQIAIEGVLILVLLLSLSIFASRQIKDRNLMGRIISEPWRQISGMMSTGNWKDSQAAMDENLHPHVNTMTRIGD